MLVCVEATWERPEVTGTLQHGVVRGLGVFRAHPLYSHIHNSFLRKKNPKPGRETAVRWRERASAKQVGEALRQLATNPTAPLSAPELGVQTLQLLSEEQRVCTLQETSPTSKTCA